MGSDACTCECRCWWKALDLLGLELHAVVRYEIWELRTDLGFSEKTVSRHNHRTNCLTHYTLFSMCYAYFYRTEIDIAKDRENKGFLVLSMYICMYI